MLSALAQLESLLPHASTRPAFLSFWGWLSLVLCPRLTHARELYTMSYHGAIYVPFLPACTETMVSLILIIKLNNLSKINSTLIVQML